MKMQYIVIVIVGIIAICVIRGKTKTQYSIGPACLKKNNVNIYEWPSKKAPRICILHHQNWPVRIIRIQGKLGLIVDVYGAEGWIRLSDLQQRQMGLILQDCWIAKKNILIKKDCIVKILERRGAKMLCVAAGVDFYIDKKYVWSGEEDDPGVKNAEEAENAEYKIESSEKVKIAG